ncbi:MAG: peptide ABC transporter permease [Bdellovibrionales bacterium RBG_16_40_8]|nr:MAG: peptide ABC transporter permease [Bdellovibrionales bacterium RBG_16_40_8]
MIEKLISNPLTLKRYRNFKKIRRAAISTWIFLAILLISLTAELLANSKPIIMSYQGIIYFPAIKMYHPTIFSQADTMVTNYRREQFKDADWVIWPIVKWDPYESNTKVESYPAPPSEVNWLGTDDRGRDVLARLVYGFRYSIVFALLVWLSTYMLGISLGAIMGYFGGRIDLFGQRVVEIFESVPTLLLLITLISIFDASLPLLIIFSAIFGWMHISVYTRAEFLRLRRREFVESARALGSSEWRVIFKHILPNALAPVVTFSPFTITGGISSLAVLDYLGFGLPAPTPSWGELLNQAQRNFTIAWWLAVFPSLALFLSLVVLNLIGEGAREAFDPRKS